MQVDFLQTEVVTDTLYVDLIRINGIYYTFAMEKNSEPNNFGVKEQIQGNHFSSYVERYKNEI